MSRRSDRAAERRAVKKADQEMRAAKTAARKAFDLKDPRFLGEAALAATRGPVGLALFGASRGLQVVRDRRAEQADLLGDLAADARQHAEILREKTSVLAQPGEKPSVGRRFAPLWIVGLLGGAAVAGATAYFLRDQGSSSSGPTAAPAPAPSTTAAPSTAAGNPTADASETGKDLTIDSPDPEGPADQSDGTTPAASRTAPAAGNTAPAAGSAAPGVAAGSAPQPTDEVPAEENTTGENKTGENKTGENKTDENPTATP